MKSDTLVQNWSTSKHMQNNTPSPASGGQNTRSKRERSDLIPAKWTLLNLLATWYLSANGKAVIVDPTVPGGATDDEWRELVVRTGVHISPEQLEKPWGQLSRRDFLNWCETNLADGHKPLLFGSKSDALEWQEFSRQFDPIEKNSKSLEISKSCGLASDASQPNNIA